MQKKKIFMIILSVALVLSLAACGGNSSPPATTPTPTPDAEEEAEKAPADPKVTLKIFGAFAEGNSNLLGIDDFIKKVSDKTDGTLTIEWGGGPEAIPPYQLAEALMNGVVDLAWTAHTYNVSHIPVVEGVKLTSPSKLRTNGGFEYLNELYISELNSRFLGAVADGLTYNLYSKKKINSLADFKGMTIRATPAYNAFVESLGAGAVNMNPGEAYQALERDVIQGFGWPSVGIVDMGWHEVSKYVINPPFYNVDTAIFIANPAWGKLSANQQKALEEAALEIEKWSKSYYADAVKKDHENLVSLGMEIINFPDDVRDQYYALAYEQGWKSVHANAPDNAAKLQSFAD